MSERFGTQCIHHRKETVPCVQLSIYHNGRRNEGTKDKAGKSLSVKKVDRKGQISDVLADALFRLTLYVRLQRRGASQVDYVIAWMGGLQA